MAKYRRDRINDALLKETAEIIREVKDPRVKDAFVSITAADVTPDLKFAKIYYSFLKGEPKEVAKGLASCQGFIRRELSARLNLRITPELSFIRDDSLAHGAHIASILSHIEFSDVLDEEE